MGVGDAQRLDQQWLRCDRLLITGADQLIDDVSGSTGRFLCALPPPADATCADLTLLAAQKIQKTPPAPRFSSIFKWNDASNKITSGR